MKKMKNLLSLLLALLLCAACLPAAAQSAEGAKGSKIGDFTVTAAGGETLTLSEILSEKDAVLINIFATWCGPCQYEFPFLQEAYEQYSDRVEVIALSCEPSDSDSLLTAYAEELGLTFPVGRDTAGLSEKFAVMYIPTSILVDRFGTVCFMDSGAVPDADSFARLFSAFLGEGYTESRVLDAIPEKLTEAAAETPSLSDYVVKYVDQTGAPVAGVTCQVCDDETCRLFTSDSEGLCRFTLEPKAWEIHTLMLPKGYSGDTQTVTLAPSEGGELVFELTKE